MLSKTNDEQPLTRITLIIMFNWPPKPGIVQFLAEQYREIFDQVIFTGPEPYLISPRTSLAKDQEPIVDTIPLQEIYFESQRYIPCYGDFSGYFGYYCIAQALEIAKDVNSGALFIGHDVAINKSSLQQYPQDKVWSTGELEFIEIDDARLSTWWWSTKLIVWKEKNVYSTAVGIDALHHALLSLPPDILTRVYAAAPELMPTNGSFPYVLNCITSDAAYIPRSLIDLYIKISKHFKHCNVFLVIAVPHILQILRTEDAYVRQRSAHLWQENRTGSIINRMIEGGNLDMLHPIKPEDGYDNTNGKDLLLKFMAQ